MKRILNLLAQSNYKICGISNYEKWHTCWWDNSVIDAVKEKRRLFKIWKKSGSNEVFIVSEKVAKQTVFVAKKKAEKEKLKYFENDTPTKNYI